MTGEHTGVLLLDEKDIKWVIKPTVMRRWGCPYVLSLLINPNHIFSTIFVRQYCKPLKYSGNNKIAIIALCPYLLL